MSTPGFVALASDFVDTLGALAGTENVVTDPAGIATLSKDYFWYSPILRDRLEPRVAAAAVRISDLETLRSIVSLAAREKVPITIRASATGNYGQCIPLHGGLVLDLSPMDRILSIDDGVVTAEPGARLGPIENAARARGWELRCYPSTWIKASIGGFIGGGSGGIGSVSWGGLREPGTIKRLTLLTIEEQPRTIVLDEADTLRAFHAYGTNGIITGLQLRLAPARAWDQLVIAGTSWDRLLDFANALAADDAIPKRLLTILEDPIPSYFKPIRKLYPPGHHLAFVEVESSTTSTVADSARAAGLVVSHVIPHHEPRRSPMLSDYTWNHTTLWAIKADPAYTYIQAGFGDNAREQFQLLRNRFPGEIFFHLEYIRGSGPDGRLGRVQVGGIPLVRFSTEARLKELICYCREIGVMIGDPHTCYVEDGGRGDVFFPHHELKAEADPHGLLNPGKLKHYPHNPFATAGSMPQFLFT